MQFFYCYSQFIETVKIRYLEAEEKDTVHSHLADYFLGTWGNSRKKPITFHFNGKSAKYQMDRSVCYQPLMYQSCYNYRKLTELPFHLIHSKRWKNLLEHVLGNVDFLTTKAKAMSVSDLLPDFNLAADTSDNPEIKLIRDAFRLSKPTLEYADNTVELLPHEFLGRMLHLTFIYRDFIPQLLRSFQDYIISQPSPSLVPLRAWIPPPGGILRHTLVGNTKNVTLVAKDQKFIVSASSDNTVRYWNIDDTSAIHVLKHIGNINKNNRKYRDNFSLTFVLML